jgi:hypothetical protein
MNSTFRLRKAILLKGIAFTLIFTAVVLGYSSIFFLEKPEEFGFKGPHSVAIVGGLGMAVFGGMALLSLYMLIAYFVERFAVIEHTIYVKSVFQDRRFDPCEIDRLRWKTTMSGTLLFYVCGQKTRLDLHGFSRGDRLKIIRQIRRLTPEPTQENWLMFCHKIALPLRNRLLPIEKRVIPDVGKETTKDMLITRMRYDWGFAILFPACLAVAGAAWWFLGIRQMMGLPAILIPFWLLLRFSTSKEGERVSRVTATPQGRFQIFMWSVIVGSSLVGLVLLWKGIPREMVCTIRLAMIGPLLPLCFYKCYQSDKQRKQNEAASAPFSAEQWESGEQIETARSTEREAIPMSVHLPLICR